MNQRISLLPVLVIGFNRPDLVEDSLNRLAEYGIKDVYVALDGPRGASDNANCEASFAAAKSFKEVFNLRILMQDQNLGCFLGVLTALDWFFGEVEFGVILEDDCRVSLDFINYVDSFGNRDNLMSERIGMISAHNPLMSTRKEIISKYALIQGWATWREIWDAVRIDYFSIKKPLFLNQYGEYRLMNDAIYWWANSTRARLGGVDTWDGIFSDRMWRLGYQCLIPATNMVKNLGFGPSATHTKDPNGTIFIESKDRNLDHPFDAILRKQYFKIKPIHAFSPFYRVFIDYLRSFFRKSPEEKFIINHNKFHLHTFDLND